MGTDLIRLDPPDPRPSASHFRGRAPTLTGSNERGEIATQADGTAATASALTRVAVGSERSPSSTKAASISRPIGSVA